MHSILVVKVTRLTTRLQIHKERAGSLNHVPGANDEVPTGCRSTGSCDGRSRSGHAKVASAHGAPARWVAGRPRSMVALRRNARLPWRGALCAARGSVGCPPGALGRLVPRRSQKAESRWSHTGSRRGSGIPSRVRKWNRSGLDHARGLLRVGMDFGAARLLLRHGARDRAWNPLLVALSAR